MEEEVKGLNDYLDMVRRHKFLVLIPALVIFTVAASVAYLLPATYKSQGRILIESQEIPNDLVRTTVTSYADQRIEVIKQRIMTTAKITALVKKHKLYPDIKADLGPQAIVSAFKQNIRVKMVGANVTDPRSGRSRRASIAFVVSFMDRSPQKAQSVTNDLVTEFLSENVRTRTDRAAQTTSFLDEEANKFKRKIQLLEENIASFKDEFSDSLPELLEYNLSMVERLEGELGENQNQITILEDQVLTMSLELVNIPPFLEKAPVATGQDPNTTEQLLTQTRLEYNRLSTKYSANHPDVIRLKRQIRSLEKESGGSSSAEYSKIADELAFAESSLSELKLRYSLSHPDVKAKAKQVIELENKLETLSSTSASTKIDDGREVNPVYVQIKSKIDSSEREIARLKKRQAEVGVKLRDFEGRVEKTHQVTRAYSDLTRDLDNNSSKYKELRAKQLEAELSQNLESENKGESFTLIEPPQLPSKAEKPNRPKIVAMGAVASVGVGLGLAFLYEMFFGGVRGTRHLSQILGAPPLVVIPMINTIDDLKVKKKGYKRIAFFIFLMLCASVAAVHFFVMDLEVVWYKVLRKISML